MQLCTAFFFVTGMQLEVCLIFKEMFYRDQIVIMKTSGMICCVSGGLLSFGDT